MLVDAGVLASPVDSPSLPEELRRAGGGCCVPGPGCWWVMGGGRWVLMEMWPCRLPALLAGGLWLWAGVSPALSLLSRGYAWDLVTLP